MPDPAADAHSDKAPKALAGLAALACVACCALPVLIAAGVLGPARVRWWAGCPPSPWSWPCSPAGHGGSDSAAAPALAARRAQVRAGAAARRMPTR